MLWIVFMLICCLRTVESEECYNTDIIMGRLGNDVKIDVKLSDFSEKINKYITERDVEKFQKEIKIQFLNNESDIRIKNKIYSRIDNINMGQKEFYMSNDTVMVKINTNEAGVYWTEFNKTSLGQKTSTISGGANDNYTSIIQLECHSVSTSVGECPLSMYTVWYKNGMRMTEVDPISSQINVTVDHNGGRDVTCLVTEYFPRNEGLQTTTKHYATYRFDPTAISGKGLGTTTVTKENKLKAEAEEVNVTVTALVVSVVVIVIIAVVVVVIVYLVIRHKKHQLDKRDYRINWHQIEHEIPEKDLVYAELDLDTPPYYKILGSDPESKVEYCTIDFAKKAPPMQKNIELDSDEDD